MLPDIDAHSVLTPILQIQPNARVVLETATEKDDEEIKELIGLESINILKNQLDLKI